ncbi:MAG: hypothetical protein AAGM04_12255, partial [Pseudomonadota bacterium]
MTFLDLEKTLLIIGTTPVTRMDALVLVGVVLALLAFVLLLVLWRTQRRRAIVDAEQRAIERKRAKLAEAQLIDMMQNQNALAGRLAAM